MIHWNGPLLHEADKFLMEALDHKFTNDDDELQPHNFHSTDDRSAASRGRQTWTVSSVVDRLKKEKSKFSFMT